MKNHDMFRKKITEDSRVPVEVREVFNAAHEAPLCVEKFQWEVTKFQREVEKFQWAVEKFQR